MFETTTARVTVTCADFGDGVSRLRVQRGPYAKYTPAPAVRDTSTDRAAIEAALDGWRLILTSITLIRATGAESSWEIDYCEQ